MTSIPYQRKQRSHFVGGQKQNGLLSASAAFSYGAIADANLRGDRILLSTDLPQMAGDMQPLPAAQKHQNRAERLLRRMARESKREVEAVSRDGVRGTLAAGAVLAAVLLLFSVWYMNRAEVRAAERRISMLETRITETEKTAERLRGEIAEKEARIDVGYLAVDIGMISSRGISLIDLYAPNDALMKPYGMSANLAGSR